MCILSHGIWIVKLIHSLCGMNTVLHGLCTATMHVVYGWLYHTLCQAPLVPHAWCPFASLQCSTSTISLWSLFTSAENPSLSYEHIRCSCIARNDPNTGLKLINLSALHHEWLPLSPALVTAASPCRRLCCIYPTQSCRRSISVIQCASLSISSFFWAPWDVALYPWPISICSMYL